MNHFKFRLATVMLTIVLATPFIGNNLFAQSQDPCESHRKELARLQKIMQDIGNNPTKYSAAEANKVDADFLTEQKALLKCEQAQRNNTSHTPVVSNPAQKPPQNGSVQQAAPSNGSETVRQALIDAQRQLDAASNFRPGTYSGQFRIETLRVNGAAVDSPAAVIKTEKFQTDGKNVFGVGPAGQKMLLNKVNGNEYSIELPNIGTKCTYLFSAPGHCEVEIVTSLNGVDSTGKASLVLQDARNSGDQTMSEARQKLRNSINNNPLYQDPPKDAPIGDGSGKPSGFAEGVDFSTDKSQTKPATPPPGQKW